MTTTKDDGADLIGTQWALDDGTVFDVMARLGHGQPRRLIVIVSGGDVPDDEAIDYPVAAIRSWIRDGVLK